MPWFYNLQVESCQLRVAICDFKKINVRVASSFIRVANLFCQLEIKSWVVSCFLRGASCFLWVANLNKLFFESQVAFYELKIKNFILRVLRVESLRRKCRGVAKLLFTIWTFKMSILQIIITCLNQISKK